MENIIILDKMYINKNRIEYYFSTKGCYDKYFNKDKMMYIEYNYDIEDIPESMLTIPFVANVIPFIWLCDGKLEVNTLDKAFFECLDNVKNGFKLMYPQLTFSGEVNVTYIKENSYVYEREAAQLFSGGLDAVTTFTKISSKKPYLITHWGADIKTNNSEVWNVLKDNVTKFANEHNVKNIFLKSNYREFLNEEVIAKEFNSSLNDSWYHGIQHGLLLICSSIPMLFKFRIKTIYIASSYYEGCERVFGFKPTCGSDPSIDNNIKFATGNVIHDSYELNRQQKIEQVVRYSKENNEIFKLKVCHNQKISDNCCNCEKCYRTILGILVEGENPNKFGFNIDSNIGNNLKNFFDKELINISPIISNLWFDIIVRLKENYDIVEYNEQLKWLIDYDFNRERRKQINKYRMKNFIPIITGKIRSRIKEKNDYDR